MDLVVGAEQKSAVLTIIERSRNFFIQTKLPSKKPADVEEAVIRLLLPYKQFVHTITTDNGVEFMNHKNICNALTVPFISQTRIAQGKRARLKT